MSRRHFLTFCPSHKNALSCFQLLLPMSNFKYLKSSILVLLFIGMSSASYRTVTEKCDDIEVKLKITHTTNLEDNGEVIMEFKKSEAYTYFVFSGTDQHNRLEGKGDKVSDLAKGEYNLYLQSPDGCTKHLKFKIN